MRDLNDLYFFVQVVDHRGFAPAARALGVPKSRLSRRVKLLEERLGVRLIHRSTRRFAVTELGEEYYRHCVAMLVEADAAEEAIERSRAEPQGVVKVSCPPALLCFQAGDMIARYMAANPKVDVHLESTSRRVDVIAEGIDVAIRVRFPPLEESDLIMRVLAPSTQRLVASPGLVADLPRPLTLDDLDALPSMDFAPAHGEHQWRLEGPNGAEAAVAHAPRLITDDMIQMRLAALAGVGVVQLPMMMVDRDLAAGALVDVLPDWRPRSGLVHAVFASRRGLLPAVRGLIDHLAEEFADIPA
ncbi:LysR family transcriptional regulator [Marinicauda salina]|uniref:LysR family transcriptional regulator n=1 Tax=Marinicauda salina TaxID=2135793 RepID=A0A2U2BTZ1_9PROT|nr:LysR family transcriptional regulator [Marinicauda salina]PWE17462.1 LysR family transcriptional regulator [Marinicauda salina]